MTTYTSVLPLQITQFLDPILLSRPIPKFREDLDDIIKMYLYIMRKMEKKCNDPIRQEKFRKLQEEFLDLYERIEKKEKDLETASEDFKKRSFYYFPSVNRNRRNVFEGLTKGRWNIRSDDIKQFRNNYKI